MGKTWHNPVLHVLTRSPVGWFWSWPSSSLHTPSTPPGWPAKPTPLLRSSCRPVAATAAASSLMTSERPTTGSATTPPRSVAPEVTKDHFRRPRTTDVLSNSGFVTRSQDAKVMSWWDYGYQITAMANRTILVDNNTWNNTHISRVGQVSRQTPVAACVDEALLCWLGCHLFCRPWRPQRRGPMRLWGSWTSAMYSSSLEGWRATLQMVRSKYPRIRKIKRLFLFISFIYCHFS